MTRTATAPSTEETAAWRRLASLRLDRLNVHPRVTVGDFNNRFGTDCEDWDDVLWYLNEHHPAPRQARTR